MRKTVLTGIFACILLTAASSQTASAQELDILSTNESKTTELAMLPLDKQQPEPVQPAPAPAPVVHTVAANENLSKIAEAHQTTWLRLFNKNLQIEHPDVVAAGQQITIPASDEMLAERPVPQPPAAVRPASNTRPAIDAKPRQQAQASRSGKVPSQSVRAPRGSAAGNTYSAGYCTWYAKNMRPDLPNNLGNASTWVARAAAQGLPTGRTPQVGAIGQQGNHVVYVTGVNVDGTVTVSEMNYRGLFVISSRVTPASAFTYIY